MCGRGTECPDQYCACYTAAHASRSSCATNSAVFYIKVRGLTSQSRGNINLVTGIIAPRTHLLCSAEKVASNRVNSRDSSPLNFASKAIAAVAEEFSPAL